MKWYPWITVISYLKWKKLMCVYKYMCIHISVQADKKCAVHTGLSPAVKLGLWVDGIRIIWLSIWYFYSKPCIVFINKDKQIKRQNVSSLSINYSWAEGNVDNSAKYISDSWQNSVPLHWALSPPASQGLSLSWWHVTLTS